MTPTSSPSAALYTLFARWTTDTTAHPHEALLGILALLPGASSQEVRLLRCHRPGGSHRGGGWVFIGHAERPGGIAVVGDYGV